jgi:DMSO/TMAO reductase YedYZ heme-binding membrane subunit
VSSRRLFIVLTASVAVVIVAFTGASLFGFGGNILQDRIHNLAEVGAGLLAAALALTERSPPVVLVVLVGLRSA